jgi:hypothetical protein
LAHRLVAATSPRHLDVDFMESIEFTYRNRYADTADGTVCVALEVSRPWVERLDEDTLALIVSHLIAQANVGYDAGFGPLWVQEIERLGVQRELPDLTVEPAERYRMWLSTFPYLAACRNPACRGDTYRVFERVPKRRMFKGYRCPSCQGRMRVIDQRRHPEEAAPLLAALRVPEGFPEFPGESPA